MQKTILTFGLISGLIIIILGFATWSLMMGGDGKMNMTTSLLVGYINMIISLSMIFFAIRQYRERHLGGKITFGKAFTIGILITLVASFMYVIGWMIYYNTSEVAQAYPEKYMAYMKEQWTTSGLTADEISKNVAGMEKNFELYDKNPVYMAGMTLMEIFPVGLLITLISAVILKRK